MLRFLNVFALLALAACERNTTRQLQRMAASDAAPAAAPAPVAPVEEVVATASLGSRPKAPSIGMSSLPTTSATADIAMLIRTGEASIEVGNVDSAVALVRALATRLDGYITDVDMTGGRDQTRSATLTLRVPSLRYDEAVRDLPAIGGVESVGTKAEDVGEEFVDVTALLANDRRLEQRLLDLLDKRTGKLSDVLAVESELARVRGEMDRYEGRLRYLSAHASISTLAVTVHERRPLVAGTGTRGPLATAWTQARRNFVQLVALCIAASGIVLPLGIAAALGYYLYRFGRRRLAADAQ